MWQLTSADVVPATATLVDSGSMLLYAVQVLASMIAAIARIHPAARTADIVEGLNQADRRSRI